MVVTNTETAFLHSLKGAIELELNKIADEIMREAVAKIEVETRKRLGHIVLTLLRDYTVSLHGQNLTITVRREGEGNAGK